MRRNLPLLLPALLVLQPLLLGTAVIAADEPASKDTGKKVVVARTDGEVCVCAHHHPSCSRGYLGVALTEMTPELRQHLGAPADVGVLVSRVEVDSPAERADIRVGDVITAVATQTVDSARDLQREIQSREKGAEISLELIRNSRLEEVTVAIGERAFAVPTHGFQLRHLGCDLGGVMEDVRGTLEELDLSDIGQLVREGLSDIDWDEIGQALRDANID